MQGDDAGTVWDDAAGPAGGWCMGGGGRRANGCRRHLPSGAHTCAVPPPTNLHRSSWGQADRVASFLRQPARPRKGMPSKPIVGTAISIQVRGLQCLASS